MEAIGAASSIIAVIETAAAVFSACLQYSLVVKDAKSDIQCLQDEAADLQKLLARLADLASNPKANDLPALAEVMAPGGPLQICGTVMQELLGNLKSGQGSEMKRFGLRALKWPFKSEDVDSKLVVLERCKSSFSLALATDQMKLALITNQITEEYRKGQYQEKIVQWLSNVEPGINWTNHDDARKKHEPQTGSWLLDDSDIFLNWRQNKNSFLWIWGMPGCGKTIMISSVIEEIRRLSEKNPRSVLAYFYFDFGAPAKQNALSCARYLLSSIVGQRNDVPEQLKDLYIKKCNYGHQEPLLADLTDMIVFLNRSEDVDDLYLIMDGLDEAPLVGDKRPELLDWIAELTQRLSSKLHLCVSSRPESDIKEKFAQFPHLTEIPMEESKVGLDIKMYIQRSLSTHVKLKRLPPELKMEVQETLFHGAQGMFRWVDCQLDSLKRCKTKPQLTAALRELPTSLDSTYERILQLIPSEDEDHARRALWWLVQSRRPLTIDELAEAAVIDLEEDPPFDPEYRFIFDPREQLLGILGSLVSVSITQPSGVIGTGYDHHHPSPFTPSSAIQPIETIRLSHFSVQEYLRSNRLFNSKNERLRSFAAEQHELEAYMSKCCLQYLLCYIGSNERQDLPVDLSEFPLLSYSSKQWPSHYFSSAGEKKVGVEELIYRLLYDDENRMAWLKLHAPDQPRKPLFTEPNEVGCPLHYCAYLGLGTTLHKFIDGGFDVNSKTESGLTPLHYATAQANTDIVYTLLKRNAAPNSQTRGGRTPLHEAAKRGNMLELAMLIRSDATIDLPDCDGWTPLYYACESNRLQAAQILLHDEHAPKVSFDRFGWYLDDFSNDLPVGPKADPNFTTNSGSTALFQASGWGYTKIIELLIKHGTDVNMATTYGRTALHQAAGAGALEVVKLLLAAGADPAAVDMSNYSARDLAEENNHLAVADILLDAENKAREVE